MVRCPTNHEGCAAAYRSVVDATRYRDSAVTDADARWLFETLRAAPVRHDVKMSRATHLMHLEAGRFRLYRAARCFLQDEDL